MIPLLQTPCYLIIFTDTECFEKIKEIRDSFFLQNLTHYVISEFTDLECYKYNDIVKKNREKYYPTKDERTCSESHLLCCNKFNFLLETIRLNPFNTSKFGWIDSNLRENFLKICTNYENNMLLQALHKASHKFHIQILNVCDKKYINPENKREMYEQYRWIVCGCLFITGPDIGVKICNRLNDIMIKTTIEGYGHGEEMFFLEILDEFYDDIEQSFGDYNTLLNNFIHPTKGVDYILNYIIKNYNNLGYYKESYDCCKKVLHQIENYNVSIDYNVYFQILFNYYLATYYHKNKEEAHKIVKHIMNIVSINPYFENEFNKNKHFYELQFNYCK